MSKLHPFFSIVVPIYNEDQFIREALDSIVAQTDPDWEALLVDDGSTDATPGILDEYARQDPRFRVFHKLNGGQSTAINKGVQESRGQWLCWLSGDDFFDPHKLELNRKWIHANPNARFFFGGFWLIEPDGKKIEYNLDWLVLEKREYHLISLFRANYVMGISICIDRESWLRHVGFDEKLRYAHDLDMWIRLMLTAPTAYSPDRTCTMRTHAGQESASFPIAGLLDSSKAEVRLLNAHRFVELFPGVDMANPESAMQMLTRALDFVACEPTSNYYALGFHPLLLFRIMEWLWSDSLSPKLSASLKVMFQKRAAEMEATHKQTSFGWMWKAVRTVLETGRPTLEYFPCEPHRIGEINYYAQHAVSTDTAQPIRTYLERFDGLKLDDAPAGQEPGCQLLLLLPSDIDLDGRDSSHLNELEKFWLDFIKRGYSVMLAGKSRHPIGLIDGVIFLGWEDIPGAERLLRSLGPVDTVVDLTNAGMMNSVSAGRAIAVEFEKIASVDVVLNVVRAAPRRAIEADVNRFWKIPADIQRKILKWRTRVSSFLMKCIPGGWHGNR